MNEREELRVIEALRALTGGLVVTEQDVITAHGRLHHQLQPSGPRRRIVAVAIAAAVVLIAGVATFRLWDGRQDSAPPITPPPTETTPLLDAGAWDVQPDAAFMAGVVPARSDLVGIWRVRQSDQAWLLVIGADGFWDLTDAEDVFRRTAGNRGTWTLRGNTLTQRYSDGFCQGSFGRPANWVTDAQVALLPDGSLHLLTRPDDRGVDAESGICHWNAGDRMVFDRLAPGYSRSLASVPAIGDDHWVTPARTSLPGLWVSADGAWVLTVDQDLTYQAFHGGDVTAAPDDEGSIQVEQHLVTATCRGGSLEAQVDLGYTDPVEGLLTPFWATRGSYVTNTCVGGLGAGLDLRKVSGVG